LSRGRPSEPCRARLAGCPGADRHLEPRRPLVG
jgi:hypothetical protein